MSKLIVFPPCLLQAAIILSIYFISIFCYVLVPGIDPLSFLCNSEIQKCSYYSFGNKTWPNSCGARVNLSWQKAYNSLCLTFLEWLFMWFMAECIGWWGPSPCCGVIYNICKNYLLKTWNILNSEMHFVLGFCGKGLWLSLERCTQWALAAHCDLGVYLDIPKLCTCSEVVVETGWPVWNLH